MGSESQWHKSQWHKWYGRTSWLKRQRHQLRLQPLCQMCLAAGRIVPGVEVRATRDPNDAPGRRSTVLTAHRRCLAGGPGRVADPFDVNKIPISAAIEGRGAQDMVALVLRRTVGPIRASHPHTGGKRRWTC